MRRAVVVVLLASVGCQSPRVVSRTADEGVIALPANSDEWPLRHQSTAKKMIRDHVGDAYEVVEEKEVTTGYTTTNIQDRESAMTMNSTNPFLPAARETTTSRTVATPQKEWQIHYRRVMVKPPAGDAAATGVVRTNYVSGRPGVAADAAEPPPMVVPPVGP